MVRTLLIPLSCTPGIALGRGGVGESPRLSFSASLNMDRGLGWVTLDS